MHQHNLIDPKEESPEEIQCIEGQICLTNTSFRECLSQKHQTFLDYSVAQKKHILVRSYILARADCYIMFDVC